MSTPRITIDWSDIVDRATVKEWIFAAYLDNQNPITYARKMDLEIRRIPDSELELWVRKPSPKPSALPGWLINIQTSCWNPALDIPTKWDFVSSRAIQARDWILAKTGANSTHIEYAKKHYLEAKLLVTDISPKQQLWVRATRRTQASEAYHGVRFYNEYRLDDLEIVSARATRSRKSIG